MKQGKNLQELAAEVMRQAEIKRDYVSDTRDLLMRVLVQPIEGQLARSVRLYVGDLNEFNIGSVAHEQIGGHVKIPKPYYDRMLNEAPELLTQNVNHWMQAQPTRRMVRTLENKARAFLSDRYRIMDNEEILEAILPVISDLGDCRIESCEVTERKLWLKVIMPWLETEVRHNGRQVGDIVQAGFCLGNSEIGAGATAVEPMIYRLSCRNGARMRDSGLRKHHLGKRVGEGTDAQEVFKDDTLKADDRAFLLKLRDVVGATADEVQFKALVDKMNEATEKKIEGDPVKAVEVIQKKYGFNDGERFNILKNLIGGGSLTQYGLSNAITQASQEVSDYDRASVFEKIGGEIISLNKADWKEISLAKAA